MSNLELGPPLLCCQEAEHEGPSTVGIVKDAALTWRIRTVFIALKPIIEALDTTAGECRRRVDEEMIPGRLPTELHRAAISRNAEQRDAVKCNGRAAEVFDAYLQHDVRFIGEAVEIGVEPNPFFSGFVRKQDFVLARFGSALPRGNVLGCFGGTA